MNEENKFGNRNEEKKSRKGIYAVVIAVAFAVAVISGYASEGNLSNSFKNSSYAADGADTSIENAGEKDEPQIEAGSVYTVVKDEGVSVRVSPQKGAKIIENVSNREQVILTGETYNNWAEISYSADEVEEKIIGWVPIKYLKEESSDTSESTKQDEEVQQDELAESVNATSENIINNETVNVLTANMSDEEIQKVAKELLNNLIDYSVNDTEKFKNLFIETSPDDIEFWMDICSQIYYEHFAKQIVKVKISQDPYFGIYTCLYTVAGSGGSNSINPSSINFIMCLTEDGWKVCNSEEVINSFNTVENYYDLYPEEFVNASISGRNATSFGYGTILDDTTVFEGYFDISLTYLYQNEDGSVDALLWLANGSANPVNVYQLTLVVTDDSLGEVLNQTVSCSETVNAGYSKLVKFHFEPSQVLTGTQTWTAMSSHVEDNYH